MTPKRLVLLVEGHGDVEAAPVLLKRLLNESGAFDVVLPDPAPLRVGEYSRISKNEFGQWRRLLRVAAKRKNVGGCLLLLDGDSRMKVDGQPFCAMRAARRLADEARKVGGGSVFSVALVFACMEFESWLIAGAQSLAGKRFEDGRIEFPETITGIPSNPESAPRDAKGWLRGLMKKTGYSATRDQAELTRLVDLDLIRQKGMRSFRRLESAIDGLVNAIRSGEHAVTPTSKS
jgi:hypothetical protein